ncbi:MAG: ArsR/SmtB family transcription factor [Lautropia sp.]
MTGIDGDVGRLLDQAAEYFAVLSGPARLRILHAVCDGERSVSDIISITGLSQTNASQHLALMYRAGVLRRRKAGAQVLYAIADAKVVELCRFVCTMVASREVADESFPASPAAPAAVGKPDDA